MIWKGTRDQLNLFINSINSIIPGITFTVSINKGAAVILDIIAYRSHNNQLRFKVYQKPMNRYLYIPFNSCHPFHVKRGFIKGELIRYIRNSSQREDYLRLARHFKIRLELRGYPSKLFDSIFQSVSYSDRSRLLAVSAPVSNRDASIILTIPFHPLTQALDINSVVRKDWEILGKVAADHSPLVAYSRSSNIADIALLK